VVSEARAFGASLSSLSLISFSPQLFWRAWGRCAAPIFLVSLLLPHHHIQVWTVGAMIPTDDDEWHCLCTPLIDRCQNNVAYFLYCV